MKIMLDVSPAKLMEYRERFGADFWQLRTPLTKYARATGIPYGLDNGLFAGVLHKAVWYRLLDEADEDRPVFVAMPDVVGDAQRTRELFDAFHRRTQELPRAFVLQDGIERVPIPWDDIAAVFIGGSDAFKTSREAFAAARTAKILGKWVHVGRVNTAARAIAWLELADSCDGSGCARFDHMLEDVVAAISGSHPQKAMAI